MRRKRFWRRTLKTLAALTVLGVAGIALILVLLRFEHGFPVTLPEPTGPFAVGRTMLHWTDASRADPFAPAPGRKRELIVWLWYPASLKPSDRAAEYQPAPLRAAEERYQDAFVNKYFTRDTSLVRAHSRLDADVSPVEAAYPVVILGSGLGAQATDYTTLAEDLASHGYMVVGWDAPYSAFVVVFPDGRAATRTPAGNPPEELSFAERTRRLNQIILVWSADARFLVNQLARLNAGEIPGAFRGRLDLPRLGAFGHSFGGATAAQFCRDDARCKAGINLDGAPFGTVVQEGIQQPFTFLLSDHGSESDAESREILANIQSLRQRSRDCQRMTLRGSGHFNFSDQCLLKDRSLARIAGAVGPIGERRGLAITAAYVHAFFEVHLKGASPALLTNVMTQYASDLR